MEEEFLELRLSPSGFVSQNAQEVFERAMATLAEDGWTFLQVTDDHRGLVLRRQESTHNQVS